MARYTRGTLTGSNAPVNTETQKIEQAINDTLSRKGDQPNSMEAPLDMNSNRVLNLPAPIGDTEPLRNIDGKQYVTAAAESAAEAKASEEAAELSQIAAAGSAVSAAESAAAAAQFPEGQLSIALAQEGDEKGADLIADVPFVRSHLKEFATTPMVDGRQYTNAGFYTGTTIGGGDWVYDALRPKTDHNVGTVVDPDRLAVWDGTQGDLNTLYTAAASGVGCLVRVNSETVSSYCFGFVNDGLTNNQLAFQKSVDNIPLSSSLGIDGNNIYINGVVEITRAIRIQFNGSKILMGDTGSNGTTVSGATGKIGIHFKESDSCNISGSCEIVGQGTVGNTPLLATLFDNCENIDCTAFFRFENVSIGRMIINDVNGKYSDLKGNIIAGIQPFGGADNAGSLEVLIGCFYTHSGDITALNCEKPARYMSVGTGSLDNRYCVLGDSIYEVSDETPLTSHALAIRSATDCTFGNVKGNGGTLGLLIIQYNTDSAYNVDRNNIASVSGFYPSTAASLDAGISQASSLVGKEIGTNTIGEVIIEAGGERAIDVSSGNLIINSATIEGSVNRAIVVASSTGVSRLSIGHLTLKGGGSTASWVSCGFGGEFVCDELNVVNGPSVAGITAIVRHDPAFGIGTHYYISIDKLSYEKNGAAFDFSYAYLDLNGDFSKVNIGDAITADLLGADLRMASNDLYSSKYKMQVDIVPTTGSYQMGDVLWSRNPQTSGSAGFICITSGSPGTWKKFGDIYLSATTSYTIPALADGGTDVAVLTVTGAQLIDTVEASYPASQGCIFTAWVSNADEVSVRFLNVSGAAIGSSTSNLRVKVHRP